MGLHIKSTTKFKVLIGFSALSISGVAALFSVTGVSSLFSGAFWAIVAMMGILEFGKIVVASYLARFWYDLSKTIKTYFIAAVLVLMAITSAGIFGYLSDAYQKTKGDYTIVESQTKILETKRSFFLNRKERLEKDKLLEVHAKESNQTRADSLTARNQSITRTRQDIKATELRITALENQITANEDSIGYYDTKIVEAQSLNIKGELGPLRFIADVFKMDMDQVVKYLMLMLIFVFDPLAVLLFVSLSTMIRKDAEKEKTEEQKNISSKVNTGPITETTSKNIISRASEIDPYENIWKIVGDKNDKKNGIIIEDTEVIDNIEVENTPPANKRVNIEKKKKPKKIIKEEIKKDIEDIKANISKEVKQHEFYYGSESSSIELPKMEITQSIIAESKPEIPPEPKPEPQVSWVSANSPLRFRK